MTPAMSMLPSVSSLVLSALAALVPLPEPLQDGAAAGPTAAAGPAVAADTAGSSDVVGRANAFMSRASDWLIDPEGGIKFGINLLVFAAIMLACKIIGSLLTRVIQRAMSSGRVKTSDLLREFFVNTTRRVVLLFGLVMGLGQLGIDVGPLLAGAGVVGFVVGFALQETLSNFAAGVMILLYRPYDIGDVVEVAGQLGKVNAMSLVNTILLTPDNQRLNIPNGSIWNSVIRNITAMPTRRVDMVFGISYGDDMDKAATLITQVVQQHALVLKDPAPQVAVSELGESSVNLVCRPWCKTADYWTVKFELTQRVKERFTAEGITIPFPQRDVHLHQAKA